MGTHRIGFNEDRGADGEMKGSSKLKVTPRNPYEMIGLKRPPNQMPEYVKKKKG